MNASIPQRSKDSSIAGESVWTERETTLKPAIVAMHGQHSLVRFGNYVRFGPIR